MKATGGGDNGAPWEALTTDLAKKLAVAATVAAVAFAAPGDALAARSGGRMGGRSFSSPSVRACASERAQKLASQGNNVGDHDGLTSTQHASASAGLYALLCSEL